MSLSQRILGYMAVKKVSSYREIKNALHEDKKKVSGTLFYLCKIRKLHRLPFSTKFGKIIFVSGTDMNLVWEYCLQNDLIPSTTKLFLNEVSKNGAVSTTELYDKGLDIIDVRFFIDAFTKQWKFLKIQQVNQFNIFYRDETALKKYMSENMNHLNELFNKEQKRRNEEGKLLEDVVERFYQSQGFATKRRVWFTTEDLEKIEIDILAEKHFFNFENDRAILIAIQCKSWIQGEHTYNLTEFLNYYCKLKQLFPSALLHIWSYNYSKYFFTSSFAKRFPDVSFYYSKHIREVFKVVNLNARKMN